MNNNSKQVLSLVILILFISLCAFFANGASVLISEVVSKESSADSTEPAIAVDSAGVIQGVWSDSTDLSSGVGVTQNNGPDKDIFYNYRINKWSTSSLVGSKFMGGALVLSDSNIISSSQPDIAIDSNNVSHVVWSALIPPTQLTADIHTTFLAHFNSVSSLSNADYTSGDSSVRNTGPNIKSSSITSNALIQNSLDVSEIDSYLNFSAVDNFNELLGTIEFWFNPVYDIENSFTLSSLLFELYNGSNGDSFFISYGGYYYYPTINVGFADVGISSEHSYIYPLRSNEWHHIAITYNASNSSAANISLYIDGYLSANNISNVTPGTFSDLCIGNCLLSGWSSFARIDELMISDNIRTPEEIRQHAGNRSIFYRTITNRSILSSQVQLTNNNLSYYPRLTADQDNNIHLVYNELNNRSSLSVKYMMKNSTGWSAPELVSNGTFLAYMPDIAVDLNKTSHVVWEEFSPDNLNISYIHYEKKEFGGSWNSEENVSNASFNAFVNHDLMGRPVISSFFPKKPKIIVGSSNITRIVWVDNIDYPDPGLTFYASFNKDLNATYSKGSPTPGTYSEAYLVNGTHGGIEKDFFTTLTAVNLSNKTASLGTLNSHLNYSAASNFNITRGTLTMWFKPSFDPSNSDINRSNVIFSTVSNTDDSAKNTMTISFFNYAGLVETVLAVQFTDKDYNTIDDLLSNGYMQAVYSTGMNPDEWYHLGFSWDINNASGNRSVNIYLNGEYIAPCATCLSPDNNYPIPINESHNQFYIGAGFNYTLGFINISEGVIDEVKIFNKTQDESQIYGDMVSDYDIFYREKNAGTWSDTLLVSNESNYMALNPSITEINNHPYIAWSQAESKCDLSSTTVYHCAFFRTVSALYNNSIIQLGNINDESNGESFYPDIASYIDQIYYIWEDNTDFSGNDLDVIFRSTANSTKPVVNITGNLDGQIFAVINFTANEYNISLNATANDSDSTVSNVTFYYTADGITGDIACSDYGTSPYSCNWNIIDAAEDYYKIKAIATSDDSGRNWDITDSYVYIDSSPGIKTYVPSTGNLNNKAFYMGYNNWTTSLRSNVSIGQFGTITTTDDISSPDSVYLKVKEIPSCGFIIEYVNSLTTSFYINDSVSDIKSLDIYWKGRGYGHMGFLTNLSIWNFNTSSWQPLAYKDFTLPEDDVLRYTFTSNISNYLEPTNNSLFVLVETEDRGTNLCLPTTLPPCPVYSSWNGTDYIFETEGLLGLLNKRMESITYDRLNNVQDDDNQVKIRVSEILPEISYFNYAELISIDHPSGTDVYPDNKGQPHTIKPEHIQPVECQDKFGNDCSDLIEKADERPLKSANSLEGGLVSSRSNTDAPPLDYNGNAWVSDIEKIDLSKDTFDYLYITFPENTENAETAKLLISGSETGLMSFSEYLLFAIGIDHLPVVYSAIDNTFFGSIMRNKILNSAKITIQVLDQNGKWIDYPENLDNAILGAYETIMIPLDTSLIRENRIRIKTTAFAYMIDFIGIDYSEDEPVLISYSEPRQNELKSLDESRVMISENQSVDLEFDVEARRPGYERTYLFSTAGYYHPLESIVEDEEYRSGIKDIMSVLASDPLYALMYADDDYAKKHLIEKYLETDIYSLIDDIRSSLLKSKGLEKHNTLYTDFIKVTVSTCSVPSNNMEVTSNTTLCSGTYHRPDNDFTDHTDKMGIIKIVGDSITLDCNNSRLAGGGDLIYGSQSGMGFGIIVNQSSNVIIENCNISGYGQAITIINSVNVTVRDSSAVYNHIGIATKGSNTSVLSNNTVKYGGYAGIYIDDYSYSNTIKDNNIDESFLGISIEQSHYNLIRNNVVNSTSMSGDSFYGIITQSASTYNYIDNNTVDNIQFGMGTADLGKLYAGLESSGYGGMYNNFSRNTVSNTEYYDYAMIFPLDQDYYNYYEQSNTAENESIYYYVNTHGTASSYVQISDLNLTQDDTFIFGGKITLVNSSYININSNVLGNNFYGILLVNSTNIMVDGNLIENSSDNFDIYGSYNAPAGIGINIISSEDVDIEGNNISDGMFGMVAMNYSDMTTFTNNNIFDNSISGIYIISSNRSTIEGNNISTNNEFGILISEPSNSTVQRNTITSNNYGLVFNDSYGYIINNSIYDNEVIGLWLYGCSEPIHSEGNIIENNTGDGILIEKCTGLMLNSDIITHNNSDAGLYLLDSDSIFMNNIWSNSSRIGILFNNTNNSRLTDVYIANNTEAQVFFYSSVNNTIVHGVIINNLTGNDTYSTSGSSNNLLNTTFNRSNTDYGDTASNLSVQWHLDFSVQDNESFVFGNMIPIQGVNITITDNPGDSNTYFTDSSGYIYTNVSEYLETSAARTYLSNYSWKVLKEGYNFTTGLITPYQTETNMTTNQYINLSMLIEGGFEDTTPPTSPIVLDGPDYTDIDYFSNTTSLSASWYNSTDRHLIFYSFRILENGICLTGYCGETYVGLPTTVTVGGLNLTEGNNYTFAVRARDSLYWFAPFSYSDGAIADFTKPNVTVSSTTHPDQDAWYNDTTAVITFYGNDSLSGIAGFSYILDQNSGTGPDLIVDSKPTDVISSASNNGAGVVIKTNSAGEALAVFSEVKGNLSIGDNVTITMQLSEDISDLSDLMGVQVYLVGIEQTIDEYSKTADRSSTIFTLNQDISHKPYSSADTYSALVTVTKQMTDSFYIAVAGVASDDDNSHNLSLSASDSDVNTSTSDFICGESSGCTNVTSDYDFAISLKRQINNNVWQKTYTNLLNGENYFHIRALDVAGNWGEPEHFRIRIDAVSGAPELTTIRPRGYVATETPTFVVETNEYATCYYNTTGTLEIQMISYDGLHHEAELSLSEGNYTYGINCTDRSGNTAYNSTSFIIDLAATPDQVIIWSIDEFTAGQKMTVYVNVTKDYEGISYGLGELSSSFSVNITNTTPNTYGIPFKVTDKGAGLYILEFTAPIVEGVYTLTVGVGTATDTESFIINSYSLTIRYTGTTDVSKTMTRMAYGKTSNYAVGVGVDAEPSAISGSTSQVQVKYIASYGNGFIFFTNVVGNIDQTVTYLDKGTFLDLDNPSFGHGTFEEEHVLSTILDYDNIHLLGTDKVYTGRYSLLIRNDGINVSSGKTKIIIEII